MNVRELREILAGMGPDLQVVGDGHEDGLESEVAVRPCTMYRDRNGADEWWLGRHAQAEPGRGEPAVWIRGLRRCKK